VDDADSLLPIPV